MNTEHAILTYLKDKPFVWGGVIEDDMRAQTKRKASYVSRLLRLMNEEDKIEKTYKPVNGRESVLYKHTCSVKCGDVQDNRTGDIYHKIWN